MITAVFRIMQGSYKLVNECMFVVTSLLCFQFDVLSLMPLDLFYLKVGVVPWLRLPRYLKVSAFSLHVETIMHFLIWFIKKLHLNYVCEIESTSRLKKKIATCISSLTLHLNINTKYTYKCSYSNTVEAFTWS